MIKINLLPYQKKVKQENVRRQVVIFFLIIAALVVPLTWYHFKLKGDIQRLETETKKKKTELKEQKNKAKQVKEYDKKLTALKKKIAVIDNLQKERSASFDFLVDLTNLIVKDRMWFETLEIKEKTATKAVKKDGKNKKVKSTNVHIKLTGVAMDDRTVADFMKRLEDSNIFSSVVLGGTVKKDFPGNVSYKKFSFSCVKKPLSLGEGKEKKPGKSGNKKKNRKKKR